MLESPNTSDVAQMPRPRTLVLPDVTGLALADARAVLDAAGLSVQRGGAALVVRYVTAYAPEWTVVQQTPAPGQLVETSSPVEVHVSRASWLRHLPHMYTAAGQEHAFLGQFLRIFEHLHDQTSDALARVPDVFRPLETETAFLPWLATWVAVHLEPEWPEQKKRAWLRLAPTLFARRGTRRALELTLEMHLGFTPVIEENAWPDEPFRVGVASTIGVTSTLVPELQLAHCFIVRLPFPAATLTPAELARIHRVIHAEKPAHTAYSLVFATPDTAARDT